MQPPVINDSEQTKWTESEYLEGIGLDPNIRYEFVHGRVYTMAPGDGVHAEISANLFVALRALLKGKPCRAFMGDIPLRVDLLGKPAFYIPDVMVACDEKPTSANFCREPLVLVEVMSPSTVGADSREKLLAYTAIPSLRHYLIIHQSKVEVAHYQRDPLSEQGWSDVTLTLAGDLIQLPELGFTLTVEELYAESGLAAPRADSVI